MPCNYMDIIIRMTDDVTLWKSLAMAACLKCSTSSLLIHFYFILSGLSYYIESRGIEKLEFINISKVHNDVIWPTLCSINRRLDTGCWPGLWLYLIWSIPPAVPMGYTKEIDVCWGRWLIHCSIETSSTINFPFSLQGRQKKIHLQLLTLLRKIY